MEARGTIDARALTTTALLPTALLGAPPGTARAHTP